MTSLVEVQNLIEPARHPFLLALGEADDQKAHAAFSREAGFAAQALARSDYALKVARANPASVIAAVTNVAAIGISLNPAKRQAYLVPRKDGDALRICLDIGYMGLVDLATQSGAVRWAQAVIRRKKDTFKLLGIDKAPLHEYDPCDEDRGDIVGVYAVAKTADGDFLTHTMSIQKVFDIRDRSESWKAYKSGRIRSTPWFTDEEEMVKKTCLKQAWKSWPRDITDDRMDRAIHYLNTEGGEGLAELAETHDLGGHVDDAPSIKMPQRRQQRQVEDVQPKTQAEQPTEAPAEPTEDASAPLCTEGERAHIRVKAGDKLPEVLGRLGIVSLDRLTKPQFQRARKIAMEMAA